MSGWLGPMRTVSTLCPVSRGARRPSRQHAFHRSGRPTAASRGHAVPGGAIPAGWAYRAPWGQRGRPMRTERRAVRPGEPHGRMRVLPLAASRRGPFPGPSAASGQSAARGPRMPASPPGHRFPAGGAGCGFSRSRSLPDGPEQVPNPGSSGHAWCLDMRS